MAEVTAFRNNALPYPVYGVPYVIEFPILDADGAGIASAAGLDSEIIKNGDTLADCTNEAIEIGGGWYYLILTAAEMTADSISIEVRSSSTDAQTVRMKLSPRKLVSLRSGTAQGGAAGYITLDASAGAKDDIWNGCLCVATIDSNVEARIITDYTASSQQATVTPSWNVTPDSDDTFIVYLPEGRQINEANLTTVLGAAATSADLDARFDDVDTAVAAVSTTIGVAGAGLTAINLPDQAMNITGNITGNVSGSVGSVTGNVGGNVVGTVASVVGAVGSVTGNVGGNVTGSVGSLATQAKTDVNAEVVDVLSTDTFAELAAIPAATSSLKDKLTWMFMFFRNRLEQTATTKVLKADDGTTTVATFTESDNGTTYTSGEGS